MASGETTNKFVQMQQIHQRAAREVAELRRDLEDLKAKETFLREEMLLHQAALQGSQSENGDVRSNNTKLLLTEEHVVTLKKVLDVQKRVSCVTAGQVMISVKQVEGLDEAPNPDLAQIRPEKVGVIKTLEVAGDVGDTSFKITCDTKHTMENQGGEIVKVDEMVIDPFPDHLHRMLKSKQAIEPTHIGKTLSNLRFFQMLEQERRETLLNLIEDVRDLSVNTDVEPVDIEFLPTREQRIVVKWGIVYDPKNHRVLNNVDVVCSDDVVAYYSQNKEVFPVLSGEEILSDSEAVADFFRAF